MALSKKGELFTEAVLGITRLNGMFMSRGERTAAGGGLTAARWSVLGTLVRAGQPLTVPEIARIGGQARQGIQRLVNTMVADELLDWQDNPGHATSRKVVLTEKGRKLHSALRDKQELWSERCAKELTIDELKTLIGLIGRLTERLEK
jgi:DNA-binding MarR family transcriptional regulator